MADPINEHERLIALHLFAGLKQQVDGLSTQIDAVIIMLSGPQSTECPHPEGRRIDSSTMGHKRWSCQDCGFEFDEPTKKENAG